MSLYDYQESMIIAEQDRPFYALLMATMRQANTVNAEKMRECWPDVWDELVARYNAPGGKLKGE